jgi:DNA-binding XRE family transcriptional regulator
MPPLAGSSAIPPARLGKGGRSCCQKPRLANGENAIRVLREWRDMIQGELAVAVGISQNYLSEIETGRRKGPAELQKKFARALGVPIDLLID